ncbi:uncharacterized protein LOC131874873 [Cryptomeria japonica]|uniref:uncharacterized protein LOC131874873 n=1 Tax=Cryptomeria japonica TaxID=3369 RepID=UPI0027DA1949|nr:uncharacterized protein LOC131874873 [Cryptomeria japonica]
MGLRARRAERGAGGGPQSEQRGLGGGRSGRGAAGDGRRKPKAGEPRASRHPRGPKKNVGKNLLRGLKRAAGGGWRGCRGRTDSGQWVALQWRSGGGLEAERSSGGELLFPVAGGGGLVARRSSDGGASRRCSRRRPGSGATTGVLSVGVGSCHGGGAGRCCRQRQRRGGLGPERGG